MRRGSEQGADQLKVADLQPIHPRERAGEPGTRERLAALTDAELMETVVRPANGQRLRVEPETGRVFQGNARAYELLSRAANPGSSITPDTEVPYEPYMPARPPQPGPAVS